MKNPSIFSAIQKLRLILSREEKIKWLGMVAFALLTSALEVLTTSLVVVFAQILNQPEKGQEYLKMAGILTPFSPGRLVFFTAITVGVVYLFKNLIALAEIFYQNFCIQKMNYNFKSKLLHKYADADYESYLSQNSSYGMQIIGSDVELMFVMGMISLAGILSEALIFIFLISIIVYMNPSLAIFIFGFSGILYLGVSKLLLPSVYRFAQKLQESMLYSRHNLIQFFHGFKEIILLGKKEVFIDDYQMHSRKSSQIGSIQAVFTALPRITIEILFVGLFVTTVAFLCLKHESLSQMLGILGGYIYVGFRLMPGLNRIINHINNLKSVIPSIERVGQEYTQAVQKESYIHVPGLKFSHSIQIEDVSFRYLNSKKESLKKICLEIKKGECIGIVGETGSGKSTLVDLLLGLIKPCEGSILIDGQYPVSSYEWHKKIGYVPQNVYLIDDTIAANIAFGEKEIDEQKLNFAIKAAQLSKFIEVLPEKAQTSVGERGVKLSGGERQRIAIARALYHLPDVLIFDEATSALDTETEERLMNTIYEVSQNYTVIMVAHRLSTLKGCSKIIVMEEGAIREITSYPVLMGKFVSHIQN